MAFEAGVKITDEGLNKSAHVYRKQLLMMPMKGLQSSVKHMTLRPGVRGKETIGQLSGNIELGPYDEQRIDKTQVEIVPRTLETYLGSVIKKFSPNSVVSTVYGSLMTKGESLKSVDISVQVLLYLSMVMGANINKWLFKAKRNDSGTLSKDLFDGFDEITSKEKTADAISTDLGNLYTIEKITAANAVDQLKAFYRAADDELREVPTKLFIPQGVYDAYVDDYQNTVGSIPYNTSFEKRTLEGSNGLCELVPLANKKDSPFIHLTTQSNMLVGFGNGGDEEKILVEKHHPFVLDFVATMFFGVQFETLSKERLLVGTIDGTETIV